MTRILPVAAILLAAAAAAAAPLPAAAQSEAPATEAPAALLAEQGERWLELLNRGDWAALRALYADDAVLMTQGQAKIEGADAILTFLQRVPRAGGKTAFAFQNEEVVAEGPLGFVTAKYMMTLTFPGRDPIVVAGRSFLVYRWEDGTWKLWRDIDNLAPDASAEAFAG